MLTVRNRIIDYVFELAKTSNAFDVLEQRTNSFTQEELTESLLECGVIPEAFDHDSSEEKLWAKYCDILLSHAFNALGLTANVLQVRGNSADVFASTASYTIVSDAKAFRLSRTAKNQKDFKITALDAWRRQNTFACLAGPLTQFPVSQSQIYQQAVHKNVTLISYTHLRFLIEHQPPLSLETLWNVGTTLSPSGRASEYWAAVDNTVSVISGRSIAELEASKQREIAKLTELGNEGIVYWKGRIDQYRNLSREDAIEKLIKAEKIDAKIPHHPESNFMDKSLNDYINKITLGDCMDYLPLLPDDSVHLCLSDIPYGINLDQWDVLHANTNSALLGQSPAQIGKSGFKRRGKPINGWNAADRKIPQEYQLWCRRWTEMLFPLMKEGGSVFIFGARRTLHRAIVAFEDSGFLLRDVLAWEKINAHHRAQSLENLIRNRGLSDQAEQWAGWKVGNLAPMWEPIAWFFKPYRHTIIDNVLQNEVGGINVGDCLVEGKSPTNVLKFEQEAGARFHEAQKPLDLIKYLITLTTREDHVVLDPFMGSGTTAIAAQRLQRQFVGFEIYEEYWQSAQARLGVATAPPSDLSMKNETANADQLSIAFESKVVYHSSVQE